MKTIKPSNQLEKKLKQFDEKQKKLIFKNLIAIQLTEGCSTGCKDCGLGAEKGVTDYIPPKILIGSLKKYGGNINNKIPLYFASDPFDYDFEGFNYLNILESFKKFTKIKPWTITSIPKGKEKLVLNILMNEIMNKEEGKTIDCISLTEYNYKRIESFFNKHHTKEVNSLKQPTDSKYYNSKNPFEVFLYNLNFDMFRNYYGGRDIRHQIGNKHKENPENKRISHYQGTLITPKGIFNILPIKTEPENPIGQKITEINFKNSLIHSHKEIYNQ